ncbi:MAG TPA: response regulator [Rhizomicrobium sp.]|nr:response regulator [Rhizomicrobium sp.]
MSRLSFDTAEVLVYDPVSSNRNATRASLYQIGFRRIETVATIDAFVESVRRRPPDLALCEAQGTEAETCDTIQNLRQGATTYNPFIVIIVTAWEQTSALVNRVLNSGADDLLLRPFSTTTLQARVRSHIERRKGFVVTTDYIGPDRRRAGDPTPSNINIFEPPNSLRMKAHERLTSEEATQRLDKELKTARDTLSTEKLRRDTFQVCILWRLIGDINPASEEYARELAHLRDKARAISRRCSDIEFEKAVEWCESVQAAIEGLEVGIDRNASMHMLGHAALNLSAIFTPEKTEQEHLKEVDATVVMIKARSAPKLAS